MGGMQGSSAMLLAIPDVQKELAVSDEQKKQVDELVSNLQEQMRGAFGSFEEIQNLSQEERQKRLEESRKRSEEANKNAEEKLGKILDAKQLERLNQLRLQREGQAAFNRAEIAKQLGLTDDQQAKIRKIQEESRPQARGGFGGQNLSEEERSALFAQMRERREKAQADVLAVLTDEQKTKWAAMKGKEFKFPEPQGGFGGFDRGGRGGRPTEERQRPERKKDN